MFYVISQTGTEATVDSYEDLPSLLSNYPPIDYEFLGTIPDTETAYWGEDAVLVIKGSILVI